MSIPTESSIASCRAAVSAARRSGKRIGFVPTMGALHEGHLSLIDRARERAEFIVVSIYVNPLQFGPGEDFAAYPRDLDRDVRRCEERGAHLIFAPDDEAMYGVDAAVTRITMDGPAKGLEGTARPGHFDGVLTVVAKLFNIVQPDVAVFGRKDAQQCAVIRRMVRDLDVPVEIVVAPTIRAADGVAESSRNAYLSADERAAARGLYRALDRARSIVAAGVSDPDRVESEMATVLDQAPIDVEYAMVVDGETFERPASVGPGCLAVVAARVGTTRLIDNVELRGHG